MSGVEQAREQVITYEQGAAEAQAELQFFEETNDDSLRAIKSEFEDYKRHPLWQEYSQKQSATDQPATTYRDWYGEGRSSIGWEGTVLFHGVREDGYDLLNQGNPERSVLPLTAAEFDRRATIASHIGEIASILRVHRGEPIVSLAGYHGNLEVEKADGAKQKGYGDKYWYGQVGHLPKTRAIVGTIDKPDKEPALTTQSSGEEDSRERALRLKLVDEVTGVVSAYSLPESKRQLRQQMSSPYYEYRGGLSDEWKRKTLPAGNSVTGGFSLDQLRGHDLVVIDGPHLTAADHEFSDDIVLYRPKQKIKTDDQSRDQEITVTPSGNTELYEATIVSEDHEITLLAPRHHTIWLVGAKAIEANLADAISDLTCAAGKQRGSDQAILRAAQDLIKFAVHGRPIAELAA